MLHYLIRLGNGAISISSMDSLSARRVAQVHSCDTQGTGEETVAYAFVSVPVASLF